MVGAVSVLIIYVFSSSIIERMRKQYSLECYGFLFVSSKSNYIPMYTIDPWVRNLELPIVLPNDLKHGV